MPPKIESAGRIIPDRVESDSSSDEPSAEKRKPRKTSRPGGLEASAVAGRAAKNMPPRKTHSLHLEGLDQPRSETKTQQEILHLMARVSTLKNICHSLDNEGSQNTKVMDYLLRLTESCFNLENACGGSTQRKQLLPDDQFAWLMKHTVIKIKFEISDHLELGDKTNKYKSDVISWLKTTKTTKANPRNKKQILALQKNFSTLEKEHNYIHDISARIPEIQNRLFDLIDNGEMSKNNKEQKFYFAIGPSNRRRTQSGIVYARCAFFHTAPYLFWANLHHNKAASSFLGPDFKSNLHDFLSSAESFFESGAVNLGNSQIINEYAPYVKFDASVREYSQAIVNQINYLQNNIKQRVLQLEESSSNTQPIPEAVLEWVNSFENLLSHLKSLAEEMMELAPQAPEQRIDPQKLGFTFEALTPTRSKPSVNDACIAERQPSGVVVLRKRKPPGAASQAESASAPAETKAAAASSPVSKSKDRKRYTQRAEALLSEFESDFNSHCARCTSDLDTRPPSQTLAVVDWMQSHWRENARQMLSVASHLKRAAQAESSNTAWCDQAFMLAKQLEEKAATIEQQVTQQEKKADPATLIKLYQYPQAAHWKILLHQKHIQKVSKPTALDSTKTLFECRIDPVQTSAGTSASGTASYKPVFLHIHTASPVEDPHRLMQLPQAEFTAIHLKSDAQKNLGATNYGRDVHRSKVKPELMRAWLAKAGQDLSTEA
jgi:hypothetical protein